MSQTPELDEYGMPIEAAPIGPERGSLARADRALAARDGPKERGIAKLLKERFGDDPEKLNELIEEVEEAAARIVERGSFLTRRLIGYTKDAYEVSIKHLSRDTEDNPWSYEAVKVYSGRFIEFRARIAKGKGGGLVKAETVGGWYSCLVVAIARYTYDPVTFAKVGPRLLYQEKHAQYLLDRVKNVITTLKLDRHSTRNRKNCGLPEAQLIIEFLMKTSVDRGRLVRLQLIAALIICLACATRPSSLVAGHAEAEAAGAFMKMGDFRLHNRGSFAVDVQMIVDAWKGRNDSITGTTKEYWLRALTKSHNIIFDTFWIVIYIWARGCLARYPTLHDLLTTQDDELIITSPEEPFLLKPKRGGAALTNEPWVSDGLSASMSATAKGAGLKGVTMYSFRRGFANDISIKLGSKAASESLGHKDAETVLGRHYSFGAGNYDLLGVRVGEATDQYRPGAESAMQMRVRVGTAVTMISKAIAQSGTADESESEDESEDESESESDDDEASQSEDEAIPEAGKALKKAQEEDKKFIEEFQEKWRDEDEKLQAFINELAQRWTDYLEIFERGSPLFVVADRYKKTQIGILNNITSHELYKKAAKKPGFLDRVLPAEEALRNTNTEYRAYLRQVNKRGKIEAEKVLEKQKETSVRPTIQDKDAALAYVQEPSSLLAAASKAASTSKSARSKPSAPGPSGSNTGATRSIPDMSARVLGATSKDAEELIAEINREEEAEPLDEVTGSIDEIRKNTQTRLGGKEHSKAVDELIDGPLGPENGQWLDQDEKEHLTIATPFDMRYGLSLKALDPILFEREVQAQVKADDDKIICQRCRAHGVSDDKLHKFKTLTKLKQHMWQQHTEWSELVLKMKCGDRFMCPGACGTEQQFDSMEAVYDHCLSEDCTDAEGFRMMKAVHDKTHDRRYKQQSKYGQKGGNPRHREVHDRLRREHLQNLTEEDLLELGDEYEFPREEVEPHVGLMLQNLHYMSQSGS